MLEEHGYDALSPILTMILVYMGSPHRMKNPHMRAGLAECLEGMIPNVQYESETMRLNIGGAQRERLFTNHPYRGEVHNLFFIVFT